MGPTLGGGGKNGKFLHSREPFDSYIYPHFTLISIYTGRIRDGPQTYAAIKLVFSLGDDPRWTSLL